MRLRRRGSRTECGTLNVRKQHSEGLRLLSRGFHALRGGVSRSDLGKRVLRITSHRLGTPFTFGRRALLLALVMLAITLPIGFGVLRGQSQIQAGSVASHPMQVPAWQAAAGSHMEFEVASVRPSDPGSSRGSNLSMNAGDYLESTGNLFTANHPLIAYIGFAYKLSPSDEQLKVLTDSLPKWASTQLFAVHARASSSNPTKDQFRLMMQSLLADRFKLVFHVEQRPTPVFALTVLRPGSLGPNLRPHSSGPPCDVPASENGSVPSRDSGTPASGNGAFPFNCGKLNLLVRPNSMVLTGSRDVTIAGMTAWISSLPTAQLGRPRVDQTGLDGRYDFALSWSFVPPGSSPAGGQPEFMGLTLERAFKEQLGLYLKPTTALTDFFVVDHVEMPAPN